MTAEVSIVIPVFNAQDYLRECLDGITRMDYEDFEVIIVDDGSTDSSPDIIRDYERRDTRFRVLRQENKGPSDARNLGLSEVRSPFVCFVDADDIVLPNMLTALVGDINDADVCVGKKTRWNQIKDLKRTDGWHRFEGSIPELRDKLFRYRRSMRGATARLYSMAVIREHGLSFDTAYDYSEDMHFNYDFFAVARKAVFAEPPVYIYRIHGSGSLSSTKAPIFLKQWKMERQCIAKLPQKLNPN